MVKQLILELPHFSFRTSKYYEYWELNDYLADHDYDENNLLNIQITRKEDDEIEYALFYIQ